MVGKWRSRPEGCSSRNWRVWDLGDKKILRSSEGTMWSIVNLPGQEEGQFIREGTSGSI